jgi:hypothetical protein
MTPLVAAVINTATIRPAKRYVRFVFMFSPIQGMRPVNTS